MRGMGEKKDSLFIKKSFFKIRSYSFILVIYSENVKMRLFVAKSGLLSYSSKIFC